MRNTCCILMIVIILMSNAVIGIAYGKKIKTETYTLKEGDTLEKIAMKFFYGRGNYWVNIWEENQKVFSAPMCYYADGKSKKFDPRKEECRGKATMFLEMPVGKKIIIPNDKKFMPRERSEDDLKIAQAPTTVEDSEIEVYTRENNKKSSSRFMPPRERGKLKKERIKPYIERTRNLPRIHKFKKTNWGYGYVVSSKPLSLIRKNDTFVVKATGYGSETRQTDSTPFHAADGQRVFKGLTATNCLPFGTKFKVLHIIEGSDFPKGYPVYGTFTVQDCMSEIFKCSGNGPEYQFNVDFWTPTVPMSYAFSAKRLMIQIVETSTRDDCRMRRVKINRGIAIN